MAEVRLGMNVRDVRLTLGMASHDYYSVWRVLNVSISMFAPLPH